MCMGPKRCEPLTGAFRGGCCVNPRLRPGGSGRFWDGSELLDVRSGSGVVVAAVVAGVAAGGSLGVVRGGGGRGAGFVGLLCRLSPRRPWAAGARPGDDGGV